MTAKKKADSDAKNLQPGPMEYEIIRVESQLQKRQAEAQDQTAPTVEDTASTS